MSVLASGVLNIHWTFTDPTKLDRKPFEVPTSIVDPQKDSLKEGAKLSDFISFNQQETGSDPFTIGVKNGNGTDVYKLDGMLLSEYFNYIKAEALTSQSPYNGIMGLSEQFSNNLFLQDGVYSLWSRDQPDPIEDGKAPGKNMYGTHPFYMARAQDESWFGVFTNLAAAQDWWIKNEKTTGVVDVQAYAAGGVGDLYIMFDTSPDKVVQLYHTVVGKPVLVPQWGLGWKQCRWGYKDLDVIKQVVQNYSDYHLPLDTQFSDIDYLSDYKDFTYDPVRYKGLGDFVKDLKAKGMHWIPIMDAGVAQRVGQDYKAYNVGAEQDVFVKAYNDEIFTGQVWAVDAAFPDFFQDRTKTYWGNMLTDIHD